MVLTSTEICRVNQGYSFDELDIFYPTNVWCTWTWGTLYYCSDRPISSYLSTHPEMTISPTRAHDPAGCIKSQSKATFPLNHPKLVGTVSYILHIKIKLIFFSSQVFLCLRHFQKLRGGRVGNYVMFFHHWTCYSSWIYLNKRFNG